MTTAQFIQISKSGKIPQFKELVSLTPLARTAELIDFCTLAHPNSDKTSQDNQCQVFSDKNHYLYKMYVGAIVRTDVNTGKRKMFKHSIR